MAQLQVTFLPQAELDLADIEERIRLNNGAFVAVRNITAILEKIDLLASAPGLGRARTMIDDIEFSFFVVKRWYIVYHVAKEQNFLVVQRIVSTDYYNQFVKP